jgi:phenylalanyl-tRNA synthetase beta chain
MNFSYNWLQSFFKRKLPTPEKLADLLTLHFAEVEEIKKEGEDFVLDIDVKPNRAGDCFSHLGIAREISAITGFAYQEPEVKIREDKELKTKDLVWVEVKNKTACQRYTARVICNVKVGPSPRWIKEKLEVLGQKSINNVVDIANYVMLETGQPLHAFDLDKISDKKLIIRFAKTKEKITTLDNERYDLDKDILVISDSKEPLAIAGIKGGKKAEIDIKTKNIVLESANFNPSIIRKTSKKIDLKTDASWRFEHRIDPNLTEIAINRAAFLIQEIANGNVCQGLIDFYPKKFVSQKILLDLEYVNELLGIKIPKTKTKEILKRLFFKVKDMKNKLLVEVPTFRLDISIPEDLIEEIGRIYGYKKIPATFPISVLIPPKRNLEIFWEDFAKDVLKEAGFSEVYNYSFVSKEDLQIFNFKNPIELENPISEQYQYLRPSLIPNLLKNVQKNQKFFKEIRIFELGKIFKDLKEKRMLTGLMMGDRFFEAKGVVDLLLNKMGIANIYYDQYEPTPEDSEISIWQKGKSAEIKVNGEEIGFLGEISKRILENLKIPRLVIFDIDFEKLSQLATEEQEYQIISPYPAAIRDIAVLVPKEVRVDEVLNIIYDSGGKLIRDVDLFDIYEGEGIPLEKKSLAFHIIYQSDVKTLSSKEIDEIQKKVIEALEKNPNWEVRK